ncbi:hypothetical protein TcasGA2_TC003575 [Tribolium castaneum]|uniref:Uncharacterized protein n=1 Tax=Tribolium castaneum TaxID=7070 RepID=D6WHU7_TRICA|nr:hypothetical protein TcasGA2_TC003575 [Tribolium castaneum]
MGLGARVALRHSTFVILWAPSSAKRSPGGNCVWGAGGGCQWRLPQDEWTDEMRWCCSAISHHSGPGGPQWAAPAPHPACPAKSGPDLSVPYASRRVCPPTDAAAADLHLLERRRRPRMPDLLDSNRAVFDALSGSRNRSEDEDHVRD